MSSEVPAALPANRPVIQGFTPEQIASMSGAELSTARKILAAVFHRGDNELGVRVPPLARRVDVDAIAATFRVGRLSVVAKEASKVDPFVKYVLECEDGSRIETVRIPLEKPGRFSVCVSSQVGCALACAFCATGRLGLKRNLEVWEIAEQVRVVSRELPEGGRIHGVVFQGMGEPLANVDRVIAAIDVLRDPCGGSVHQRNITVCTAGVPRGIRRLAEAGLKVRLGLSLGTARVDARRRLMPVDKANPLSEVMDAAVEYVTKTGDAPMFAVTPLAGVNTSQEDAEALAALLRDFRARTGISPGLSLIPYNSIGSDPRTGEPDPFSRADDEEAERFRLSLTSIGVPVVRRYSGGGDVGAACGQLVAKATS
ncbi:MAG: 23S rRNA (adenine(2503)-C(2))-methyltransferase RlmN [Polyangiaceae bacterium]